MWAVEFRHMFSELAPASIRDLNTIVYFWLPRLGTLAAKCCHGLEFALTTA
jgi:hypothetical protein